MPTAGILLTLLGLVLCIIDPLSSFRRREFKKVTVTNASSGPFEQWRPITFLDEHGQPTVTTVPLQDWARVKPGRRYWLMTADWNIKGPRHQLVTPLRMVKAYPWVIALLYPVYLFIVFLRWSLTSN